MELKSAVAVCLIALVSATLVVLIARALDDRAASRLEPQLAAIVEELRAIRQGGGIATQPGSVVEDDALTDGLVVYYFHGNVRCPTCRSIESQAHDAVTANFGRQLSRREIAWKALNYEQPAAAQLTKKFDIQMPVVVLARMEAGQTKDWKRLDEVWPLEGDKPAFARFVREQIAKMLPDASSADAAAAKEAAPSPGGAPAADLPVPAPTADIPVP